ncbi:hypothetical protein ABPG74_009814 [Tetrahymena malaccensis]
MEVIQSIFFYLQKERNASKQNKKREKQQFNQNENSYTQTLIYISMYVYIFLYLSIQATFMTKPDLQKKLEQFKKKRRLILTNITKQSKKNINEKEKKEEKKKQKKSKTLTFTFFESKKSSKLPNQKQTNQFKLF